MNNEERERERKRTEPSDDLVCWNLFHLTGPLVDNLHYLLFHFNSFLPSIPPFTPIISVFHSTHMLAASFSTKTIPHADMAPFLDPQGPEISFNAPESPRQSFYQYMVSRFPCVFPSYVLYPFWLSFVVVVVVENDKHEEVTVGCNWRNERNPLTLTSLCLAGYHNHTFLPLSFFFLLCFHVIGPRVSWYLLPSFALMVSPG